MTKLELEVDYLSSMCTVSPTADEILAYKIFSSKGEGDRYLLKGNPLVAEQRWLNVDIENWRQSLCEMLLLPFELLDDPDLQHPYIKARVQSLLIETQAQRWAMYKEATRSNMRKTTVTLYTSPLKFAQDFFPDTMVNPDLLVEQSYSGNCWEDTQQNIWTVVIRGIWWALTHPKNTVVFSGDTQRLTQHLACGTLPTLEAEGSSIKEHILNIGKSIVRLSNGSTIHFVRSAPEHFVSMSIDFLLILGSLDVSQYQGHMRNHSNTELWNLRRF